MPSRLQKREVSVSFDSVIVTGLEASDLKQTDLARYVAAAIPGLETNPQEWWRGNQLSHPHLSQLARRFLAVPATSVPSERMFSSAGSFASKHRTHLDADNLEREVLLHHFLNETNRLDALRQPRVSFPAVNV